MKWTVLPLIAAALIIYGLLFAVHATRENQERATAEAEGSEGSVQLAEATPEPDAVPDSETELVTAPVEDPQPISNPEEPEVGPESVTASWEGGAWAAGCRAYEAGDYITARSALEQAVRDDENRSGRHYLLGLDYLKLGETELAVGELERSVVLDPSRVRAYVNLGRAYLELEDPVTAREVIDAAMEIQLDYADAWQVLGRIELDAGNLEGAEAAFTKATQLDEAHAWSFNNLGYVRILEQRFAEAVSPLAQAVELQGDVACFHNNLGVALERSGDLVGAVAAYQAASEIGHATALGSAERVEAIVLAQGLEEEPAEEPRLAAAPADSISAGAW